MAAKDLLGLGAFGSGGTVQDSERQLANVAASPQSQAQMALEAQLRAAVQQQLGIAVNNGNFDPGLAQQTQQRLAAEGQQAAQYQDQVALAQMSPEQRSAYDKANADNARFGTDLSWLDPAFQYSPTVLGQSAGSQAAADPNAIAAQSAAMARAAGLTTDNLQFASPGQQQAIMQQILGVQAPQFQSDAQQQQALGAINAVNMPNFAGAGTQQDVLSRALGLASNTGPGALSFDNGARQQEQYGNLQGIIAGGGADAIEMARRQAARADSESWLRGQREADMADYAERGLTGSGMELLNLSSDRQAAAQRNSAADLQTAAALEERKLGAINSAAGLATGMRGQTIDEQGLLNNRATAGLGVAGSLANSMRSSDIQEQLGLTDAALNKATAAGQLSSTMRGQTATEQLGLNSALMNQYGTAANLANTMRGQTADEQIGNRNAQLSALSSLTSAANAARGQSAQEAQFRAGSADDFAVRNQNAINSAAASNTQFLQNAQQTMMANRQQWEQLMAQLGIKTAEELQDFDQREQVVGYNQGTQVGGAVAGQYNQAQANYNNATLGVGTGANASQTAAQQAYNTLYPQMGAVAGGATEAVINAGIGAAGQGAAGTAGTSGAAGAGTNVAASQAGGSGGGFDWKKFISGLNS